MMLLIMKISVRVTKGMSRLKEAFGCKQLRFDFVEITDKEAKTKEELLEKLRSQAQRQDLENIRVLFVFVMSHGSRDVFLTARAQEVTIAEVVAEFDALKCPALENRPKRFFIQACQGDTTVQMDATADQMQRAHFNAQTHKADMVTYVCTYPGSKAGRLAAFGTFYIQAICYVFAKHSHANNVSEMMCWVGQVANTHDLAYRAVPTIFGNQTKMLYLCPGH